ncbi:MAG: hypothetical protein PWQ97_12 [Tepidanaerobacteraceae bacterium]|nr:hypothetical protein [Tepidanaerobacteraceae bacterium]
MNLKTVNIIDAGTGMVFQEELMKKASAVVDLKDVRGVRFCGEIKDFMGLYHRIHHLKPGVCFLGPGDFHHLCLHFLNKLHTKPLLVLFDHHSDMMEAPPGTISCGSWVRAALNSGKVKKCIIVGQNVRDEMFSDSKSDGKVVFFPQNIPHEKKVSGVMKELMKYSEPVYISIDKDVLVSGEAYTNWDQGSLKLEELLDFIKIIKKAKDIISADICGEWPVPPDGIFHTREDIEKIRINQAANLKILDILL